MTTSRRAVHLSVTAATVAALALGTGPAIAVARTGPSTDVAPYVVPVAQGVDITSLLTVGDQPTRDGYRMVGIPDGLGAHQQGRDLVVFENQELVSAAGIVRRHGQAGAFVSRFVVDRHTGEVKRGSDLIDPGVRYWDYPAGSYSSAPVPPIGATAGHTLAFNRFCSGALTDPGQLRSGRNGYDGQIYFANEEAGDEGRVFGVTTSGAAFQLPRLGLFSWENTLAAHTRSRTTLVMGNEDGGSGQLRAYVGTKQRSGSPVDKAGLTNGGLNVINVPSAKTATSSAAYGKGVSRPFGLAPVEWNKNGVLQNADAAVAGSTFNRIEDGSFDPRNPDDYYFVTTEGGDRTPSPIDAANATRDGGGLWRLSFEDVDRPQLGGTLTLLLDGTESPYLNKPDNMTIDKRGNLLVQEDPGGNDHLARILSYRIRDGALAVLAQFDPALFGLDNPAGTTSADRAVMTVDEESSGIIEVSDGRFLFDAQVHQSRTEPELVEEGQLLTMSVHDWRDVYGHGSDDD